MAGSSPVVVLIVLIILFFLILESMISHVTNGNVIKTMKNVKELLMGVAASYVYDQVKGLSIAGGFCTSS